MARARGSRVVRIAVAVVGVFVIMLVALVLLLQTGPVSRRVKDLVVPRASAALGREVTVQDASLRILPRPRVSLAGASVAGRPGEPPLAELESFDVSLELWPLVRSLGKDVRVEGIRLVKPIVNLVRAPDGSWNYRGLGAAGAEGEPKADSRGGDGVATRSKVVVGHAAIEGGSIKLLDRLGGSQAALAVSKIDLSADHVGLGEPLDAKLSAALAGEQKNFLAEIHASQLPESAASLGPGRYPELTGKLALEGLDLARVRAFLPPKVTGIMTGGQVNADAKLSTDAGKYRVDGSGRLSQVRLRGEPAQGSFDVHAVLDPASGAARATIDKLALKGPGLDLGGNLSVQLPPSARSPGEKAGAAAPTTVRFAIAGPLLDLGQVMGLLPQEQAPKEEKPLQLTAEQRRSVKALDVQGTIDIEKVVKGALVASGFKAKAALEQGALVLNDAHADFFGGRVDAAGTRLDLAPALPAWNLKAKLDAIDLGQALSALAGSTPVVGKMTGALDLQGAGVDWTTLKKALTGQGALALKEGALTTTDLGGNVLGAVSQVLTAAGKGGAPSKLPGATGKTELRDLAAQFTVKDGAMSLAKPLTFTAPFGAASLGGKIGLGGELALQGNANVSKETLQSLTGGAGIPIPAGLSVPLGLSGSLAQPAVNVNAEQAVAGLVTGAARQKGEELKQNVQERARREARRGLGDALKRLRK